MFPVPVCLVTGLPGAGKRRFIAALAQARPSGAPWALLDNDGGGSAQDLARSGIATAVVGGCACCSGQVLLQTGLVQLLQRARPHLLIVAVDGAAEPAALARVLQQPGIAGGIALALQLCIAPPQWLAALPEHARERLRRQMLAADGVIAGDGSEGAGRLLQAAEAVSRVLALASGASASSSQIDS
jgi:G3E family GTPase